MQTTTRASATQPLIHPQLPKIKGFYWKRIREDESCGGGLEATTLLMAPGERAAMLTIVLYPDRALLRHLLVAHWPWMVWLLFECRATSRLGRAARLRAAPPPREAALGAPAAADRAAAII